MKEKPILFPAFQQLARKNLKCHKLARDYFTPCIK